MVSLLTCLLELAETIAHFQYKIQGSEVIKKIVGHCCASLEAIRDDFCTVLLESASHFFLETPWSANWVWSAIACKQLSWCCLGLPHKDSVFDIIK